MSAWSLWLCSRPNWRPLAPSHTVAISLVARALWGWPRACRHLLHRGARAMTMANRTGDGAATSCSGSGSGARLSVGHAETIGRRPTMEDAIDIRRGTAFRQTNDEDYFGLFDGHGGRGVANWLANRLHGYVNSSLLTLGGKRGDEAVRKAIDEAFRLANASLRKEVNASFRTGSTAVIAVLLQRTLHVANCGDSRAVLCSGGAAHRLSFDHKPELPCERERIRKAGGQVTQVGLGPARVDGVLSVSRAFGDFMLAPRVTWHPYQAERRLTPADEFVVLGCDGVFDVLDDQTVVDIGREALDAGKTPAVAARQIMNASLKRGSTDNISVIVLQLGSQVTGAAPPAPAEPDPLAALEAAIAGDGAQAAATAPQADKFGDRMSGRGMLARLPPRGQRERRQATGPAEDSAEGGGERRVGRSPRLGPVARASPGRARGGAPLGQRVSDGPSERRRAAAAEREKERGRGRWQEEDMSRFQQTMAFDSAGFDAEHSPAEEDDAPGRGERRRRDRLSPRRRRERKRREAERDEISTEDEDEDEADDEDQDLGGWDDGVPPAAGLRHSVHQSAVVMARPVISARAVSDGSQPQAGGAGMLSRQTYQALTGAGAQSWGAAGGATRPPLGDSDVMGDVLGDQHQAAATQTRARRGWVMT